MGDFRIAVGSLAMLNVRHFRFVMIGLKRTLAEEHGEVFA
jgi:hypothetical protein